MKYKILNIASTTGILISFVISMFTSTKTISVICWVFMVFMVFCFVLLFVNVFLNRGAAHLDGVLVFDLGKSKKGGDNDDNDFD